MPSKNFLNNITIPSPCTADWNSMVGNDQVRFCEHCSLDVHNLSRMTRNQAQRLVARSNGRLCVRYHSDSAGRPLPLPLAQKLHRINRRVSRIAAGAFSATLSISSAVSQNSASAQQGVNPPNATQQSPRWVPGSSLAGTITDQNGALIPGATIYLSNAELRVALYASTGLDGQFRIDNLQPAVYRLRIEAPGFAGDETEGIYLQSNGEMRVDRTLKVAQIEETVDIESNGSGIETFTSGGVAIVAPAHPFVKAAHEDDLESLTALIAGMDVNLRDKRSETTALEHAVRNANRETVLMMLDDDATSDLIWDLVNAGANVNRKDKFGTTALMEVAASNNMDALKTLLDAGAEANAKNEEGQTALMLAASGGFVNSVRALVLAGADINAKDKEKMDALAHALDNDHRVVVRFLKSKGAVETVAQVNKDQ